MRDRELHWIPDETARARPLRSHAIAAAVLAVSCVVIGIVIGRLTAGTPATGSRPPEVASAKRPAEPGMERPSLALQGDAEKTTPKPAGSTAMQAEPTTNPPKVILLNPGTADKKPDEARERAFREPPENRGRQATEDRRDMLSPTARDYQSLRDYMLSR